MGSIFLWCGVLIIALLVFYAGYTQYKRWMNSTGETGHAGFSLSDLRELHRQGKMSDEEFEKTRTKMLGLAKKMTDQMPAVLPRREVKPPPNDGHQSPPAG